MGHWMNEMAVLLILVILAVILILIWRNGWVPGKIQSTWRALKNHWFMWVNRIRERFISTGIFSWYLLTGATLTVFGLIIFTKLASELLEHELTYFDTVIGQRIFSFRTGLLTSLMLGITYCGPRGDSFVEYLIPSSYH